MEAFLKSCIVKHDNAVRLNMRKKVKKGGMRCYASGNICLENSNENAQEFLSFIQIFLIKWWPPLIVQR